MKGRGKEKSARGEMNYKRKKQNKRSRRRISLLKCWGRKSHKRDIKYYINKDKILFFTDT